MDRILETFAHPLVSPVVAVCAIGLLGYVASRLSPLLCKVLALVAGAAVIFTGLTILQHPRGEVFHWAWIQLTENVHLSVDLVWSPLGMVAFFGSGAFALLITISSFRSMAGSYWEGKFYSYLILTLGGACLISLAGNLLVLLVGWELVTLMLFLMVNQGRPDAPAGAAKAYGMLGFSDACLLLAIALLVASPGGSENLSLTRSPVSIASMGAIGYIVYALILIAALAKAGAIPLHTWIPAIAKDAPGSVMALLPAALDKLLGIYLLATLVLRMFRPDWTMQVILMVIGAVTILAAVLMAMVQHNLKKLLAFHAVSQVGYMVLGIGTGTTIGVVGGLMHMINNAIYKSNLFLMSGTIRRATGSDEIEDMGGLGRVLPVTFACGLVSALAISGVPPLNGFVSKWLIYQGALETPHRSLAAGLLVVAVFGSALTLASFVKVIYSGFLSPGPKGVGAPKSHPRESFLLVAPMVVLAAGCVILGLFPGLVIEGALKPAVAEAITSGQDLTAPLGDISTGGLGLWNPTQATGLMLIGIVIGLGFVWINTRGAKVRVVRPFLAGEVPPPNDDRFRVPGTHFYETISKLPAIGSLLKHGEGGAMDLYHWSGRYGGALVELLRRQHTGLISLYVSWVLVGLTVTLVYLLLSTVR